MTRMNIEDISDDKIRHEWEQIISKLGNPEQGEFEGVGTNPLTSKGAEREGSQSVAANSLFTAGTNRPDQGPLELALRLRNHGHIAEHLESQNFIVLFIHFCRKFFINSSNKSFMKVIVNPELSYR